MNFYTIQSIEMWERCKSEEFLSSNSLYYEYPIAYLWMMEEMQKRIPGYSKNEGILWLRTYRPDLRWVGLGQRGKRYLLLRVSVEEEKILYSNIWYWNQIVKELDHLVEPSGKYCYVDVFDIEKCRQRGFRRCPQRDIQATTGRILKSNVKIVREFTAK